ILMVRKPQKKLEGIPLASRSLAISIRENFKPIGEPSMDHAAFGHFMIDAASARRGRSPHRAPWHRAPTLITYQWFRCLKASKTNDQARHCFCVRTKSAPVVQTEPQCWSSALADCLSNLILGHVDCGCRRSSPTTILPFAEMQKPIIITDNNKKTYRYPL